MKYLGITLFLLACLGIGALLGSLFLRGKPKPLHPAGAEVRPIAGEIPQIRGLHSSLTLASPLDQWQARAKHDAQLGATWLTVDAPAAAFDAPASASALAQIAKTAHDASLKLILIADIKPYQSLNMDNPSQGPSPALPPHLQALQPLLSAAGAAGIDVLALDPHMGETEPADDAWSAFLPAVKTLCKIPLCYVSDYSAYARVTWWSQVDYIGIRGPIPLTTSPDADLHKLQMSLRSRLDVLSTLNWPDTKPVLLLDLAYTGPAPRSDLSYHAAVTITRGQPWLGGLFLRPGTPEQEAIIQSEWKTTSAATTTAPATRPATAP